MLDIAWLSRFLCFWVSKWQISARKVSIHRFLLAGVYCSSYDLECTEQSRFMFCYQLILKYKSTSQYVEVWSEKEDTVKFRKCAPPSISPSKYKPHKLVT